MAPGPAVSRLDCRVVWSRDRPPLEDVRAVVGRSFELHDRSSPNPVPGAAGYRRYVATVRSALPDLEARVETAIESRDWVFYRRILTGTHREQFMGVPASGRAVSVRLPMLARIEDGRMAEAWTPGWNSVARKLAEVSGVEPPSGAEGSDPVWEDLGPDPGSSADADG